LSLFENRICHNEVVALPHQNRVTPNIKA